ncbi:MAG: patatin-like phospholipase family protein [Oscillospiraceae bacterium]|nr:patatin-like phospholipase family protein [Oscillospiraceae bacterium]
MHFTSAALAGGGGLGAYQVGVMRALAEHDALEGIQMFSGTSVGALNAVLWSLGDVELAEHIWRTWVDPIGMVGKLERCHTGFHMSRETLREVLKKADITRIKHRAPVYVCAHDVRAGKRRYFCLNNRSESEMIVVLLASSAIPVIYAPVKIGGSVFMDGNSSMTSPIDNYPIEVLYRKGARDILLVPLKHRFDGHRVTSWVSVRCQDMYELFPEADISVIKPTCDIGGMRGVVDFTAESIRSRMAMGYMDGSDFFRRAPDIVRPEGHHADVIRSLAERYIQTAADMDSFVALHKNKKITAVSPTLGGRMWYEDILDVDGQRLQWHSKVPAAGKLLRCHYRILGRNDELRAYWFDPEDLIEDLLIFGRQKETGE